MPVSLHYLTERSVVPVPQVSPSRFPLQEGIKVPGRYRLKVVVTAQHTPSRYATFTFAWSSYADVIFEQDA